MEQEVKRAEALRKTVAEALARGRARLGAAKVARARAEKERQAAAAASKAATERRVLAQEVEDARRRDDSKAVARLQRKLTKRDKALRSANGELESARRNLQEARLAQAQAEARLRETNARRSELDASRRQAAEEALKQERARSNALADALTKGANSDVAKRQADLVRASEKAQRSLLALERSLQDQRSRVKSAQEQASVEQARIALLNDQLTNERNELERLGTGKQRRSASLRRARA